jgi:inorganic pyrophosphatase
MIPHFKAHPWHGISIGNEAPAIVTAFIEILPTDTMKYEIDKATGYLKIDRPQKFSNMTPSLYGFVPQTYCGDLVAALARENTTVEVNKGDEDPLDICVLSEREIYRSDIILQAIPIGGLRLIDNHEADDKIIAVLKGDAIYGNMTDIEQLPLSILNRLRHYFLTYKNIPGEEPRQCYVSDVYNQSMAHQVIQKSREDYAFFIEKMSR